MNLFLRFTIPVKGVKNYQVGWGDMHTQLFLHFILLTTVQSPTLFVY